MSSSAGAMGSTSTRSGRSKHDRRFPCPRAAGVRSPQRPQDPAHARDAVGYVDGVEPQRPATGRASVQPLGAVMKKLRSTTVTRARASMAVGLIVAVSSLATFGVGSIGTAHAAAPSVLRVGTWKGIPGTYSTIDAAVGAAKPGDWVLVAPGDYHPQMDHTAGDGQRRDRCGAHHQAEPPPPRHGSQRCGHRRHQARRTDVQLGSVRPGPRTAHRRQPAERAQRRRVFEANDVSVDNLTVCNFLNGADDGGNQVWFNGGDGTGTIDLTATPVATSAPPPPTSSRTRRPARTASS